MVLRPAREGQDKTFKQFVFQGQCLVLGESGVGKTSLVKALTGKPFDPEEPNTRGIDQSLVNETWQNLKLKDLMFGNFSRFFKNVFVKLSVFGKAGNVIVQESTTLLGNNPQWGLKSTLLYSMVVSLFLWSLAKAPKMHPGIILSAGFFSTLPIALLGIFHFEPMRLIAIACCFFVNYRGLSLGAFISVLSEAYFFKGMSACILRLSLLLSTLIGFLLYLCKTFLQCQFVAFAPCCLHNKKSYYCTPYVI